MIIKLFEVLDSGTCMIFMAIRMIPANLTENILLQHAGFSMGTPCTTIVVFHPERCQYDLYQWPNGTSRTIIQGHKYIHDHFNELKTGDVIDIEFILKETEEKKESDIIEAFKSFVDV